MSKKYTFLTGTVIVLSLFVVTPAFAASDTQNENTSKMGGHKTHMPIEIGAVSAVNGNLLTVSVKAGTTYTVDATNAKVEKNKTTIAVSDIKVGDTVIIRGPVTGTNVAATSIIDGVKTGNFKNEGNEMMKANGAFGLVTSVTGSNFSLESKKWGTQASTTIIVTTGSTTVFSKDRTAGSIADVMVGRSVRVQGVKNSAGTTIAATKVDVVTQMPIKRFRQGKGKNKSQGSQNDN